MPSCSASRRAAWTTGLILHRASQINTHDGGRGVYFKDPDGHLMEALTVPYGGWPK